MYDAPPSLESTKKTLREHSRTLLLISAVVLPIALGLVGICAVYMGPGLEPWHSNEGIFKSALFCAGPILTGLSVIAILVIFQRRSQEQIHAAGYVFGCVLSPLFFAPLVVITFLLVDAIFPVQEQVRHNDFTDDLVHQALLATRITLVLVTALCLLFALGLTLLVRRYKARRS